jgi:hypothetical protein
MSAKNGLLSQKRKELAFVVERTKVFRIAAAKE